MVGELVVGRDELGVPQEARLVVKPGADGEDGGEQEGKLFGAHGLNLEGVVDRRDVEDGVGLAGHHPCLLCKLDVFDSDTGDDQVFRWACYSVHGYG